MSLNFINALFNKNSDPAPSVDMAAHDNPEALARMAWAHPSLGR